MSIEGSFKVKLNDKDIGSPLSAITNDTDTVNPGIQTKIQHDKDN